MFLKWLTWMLAGLFITLPLSALAEQQDRSAWIESGWQHIQKNRVSSAMRSWQQGVNKLDDKQLLGSLGLFSDFSNAIRRLKQAGRDEKVFIVRQPLKQGWYYHLLTAQPIEKDIEHRQIVMAALKKTVGIEGKLLANEAAKFKSHSAATYELVNKTDERDEETVELEDYQPIIVMDADTFTINSFEVKGNKQVSTDIILMSLRDYYGSERTDSDLKSIRRQVIDTHHISRVYNIKVKRPILIDEDTVLITITEK